MPWLTLLIHDPEVAEWAASQREPSGRLHLLIGDSIARDASLASRVNEDQVFNRDVGGATWRRLLEQLPNTIRIWERAASGLDRGDIAVWMTGNEVYPRHAAVGRISEELLRETSAVAKQVVGQLLSSSGGEVLVLGPLPRLAMEVLGRPWETTAAYHLERRLKSVS